MNKLVEQKKQELADEFIACLNEEILPWQRGWIMKYHKNIETGKHYKGINQLILMFMTYLKKYPSFEWGTFNQLNKKRIMIKKGSKATNIIYYTWYDKVKKEVITKEEVKKRIKINERDKDEFCTINKIYNVFNLSDTDGYNDESEENPLDISFILNYQEKTNLKISFSGNNASYSPKSHQIRMPGYEQFINDDEYYSTLLHEISHSTMKEVERYKPLNIKKEEEYAFEELVAEISSVFLCCECNKELKSIQNNKSYLQYWASKIKSNKDYLFKAIKSAEKITDYLVSFSD